MSGEELIPRSTARWIAHWAAQDPRIRRVWVSPGPHVSVELEPVGDSDETAAVWMAKSSKWRSQLRSGLSPDADLECLDAGSHGASERLLVYERG
jgi:hypothetical protein